MPRTRISEVRFKTSNVDIRGRKCSQWKHKATQWPKDRVYFEGGWILFFTERKGKNGLELTQVPMNNVSYVRPWHQPTKELTPEVLDKLAQDIARTTPVLTKSETVSQHTPPETKPPVPAEDPTDDPPAASSKKKKKTTKKAKKAKKRSKTAASE